MSALMEEHLRSVMKAIHKELCCKAGCSDSNKIKETYIRILAKRVLDAVDSERPSDKKRIEELK